MSKFFQKPIIVTVPMTQSFWATLRAQGVMAANMGKSIHVEKIMWNDPGPNAQYVITDTFGNELAADNTSLDFQGANVPNPIDRDWRDWQVTVLTAGDLYIYYR